MGVLMLFLLIFAFVSAWFLCGFIGFLIETKIEGWTKFDSKVSDEFMACVVLGIITLIIMVCYSIKDWFIKFMDSLLWRINNKK